MNAANTVAPNAGNPESEGKSTIPCLPIQFIPVEIETVRELGKSGEFIKVFRYAVEGGWIVGTLFDGMPALTQSFVPDPARKWTLSLPTSKQRGMSTQATSSTPTEPSANTLALRAILKDKVRDSGLGVVKANEKSGGATLVTIASGALDPLTHLPPKIKTLVREHGTDSNVGKAILAAFAPRQSFGGNKPQPHVTK